MPAEICVENLSNTYQGHLKIRGACVTSEFESIKYGCLLCKFRRFVAHVTLFREFWRRPGELQRSSIDQTHSICVWGIRKNEGHGPETTWVTSAPWNVKNPLFSGSFVVFFQNPRCVPSRNDSVLSAPSQGFICTGPESPSSVCSSARITNERQIAN